MYTFRGHEKVKNEEFTFRGKCDTAGAQPVQTYNLRYKIRRQKFRVDTAVAGGAGGGGMYLTQGPRPTNGADILLYE